MCLCLWSPDVPERFRYTNRGGDMQIPGTDDLLDLERTRNALTILGRSHTPYDHKTFRFRGSGGTRVGWHTLIINKYVQNNHVLP